MKLFICFSMCVLFGILRLAHGEDEFFPRYVLSGKTNSHIFREQWYAKHLKALWEEPLFPKATNITLQIYRFTCLRTFHKPFCLRIDIKTDETPVLFIKVTNGKGGYEPGRLIKRSSLKLHPESVLELQELLEKTSYWRLPCYQAGFGLDGSRWIIEVVCNGKYHVIDRWTPATDDPARCIGEWFIKKSKLKIRDLY